MNSKNEARKNKQKTQEKKKFPLYLGDQKYYSKLFKFYGWFFSVVLFLLGCVFLYDKAFLPGSIILVLASFNLPPIKKLTVSIPKFLRIFINLALVVMLVLSIGLSV